MKRFFVIHLLLIGVFGLFTSPSFGQEGVTSIGLLPKVPIPSHNLDYEAKIELGKKLFFDPRLSGDNTRACAFCHQQEKGFADGLPRSLGLKGELGRHSPSVFNTAYNDVQFWDGRAGSLEEQASRPIPNPDEMNQNLDDLVKELSAIPGYVEEFKKVYGTGVSVQGIASAIAAFERTVISTNSPFDKFMAGDKTAMAEGAQRGMRVFLGKGRCVLCHNGPNFTDNKFHNLGVPQAGPLKEDLGRFNVTKREADKGAFKTPTLRSIAETAPYMHDGALATLEEVVEFYSKGGGKNPRLDPLMAPLTLTDPEKKDLVEFLRALTGERLSVKRPDLPK